MVLKRINSAVFVTGCSNASNVQPDFAKTLFNSFDSAASPRAISGIAFALPDSQSVYAMCRALSH